MLYLRSAECSKKQNKQHKLMLKLITKISVTKSTGISGNEITITIVNLTEILIANKSKLHFELLIDLVEWAIATHGMYESHLCVLIFLLPLMYPSPLPPSP